MYKNYDMGVARALARGNKGKSAPLPCGRPVATPKASTSSTQPAHEVRVVHGSLPHQGRDYVIVGRNS